MHKTPPPSSVEHPETAADGREAFELAIANHYDFIKSYQHLNQETYDAIETAAHAAQLITVGHLPELGCSNCASPDHPFLIPMNDFAHAEELGRFDAWQPEHTRYLSEDFRKQPGIDRYPAGFDFDRVLTRKLFRSGTPLLIGADAPTVPGLAYGYSVHQEMLEINSLGFTPYQVLRS
jgi:hypothetical protein